MVVATYFYREKVRRTMRTAIVSNLLNNMEQGKWFFFPSQLYWWEFFCEMIAKIALESKMVVKISNYLGKKVI